MKIALADIDRTTKERPSGFKDSLFASGSIQGEFLLIEDQLYYGLRRQFPPSGFQTPKIEFPEPSIAQKAINYAGAVGRRVEAKVTGKPTDAPKDVLEARLAICHACERLTKTGTCAHMNCGCPIEKKAAWATERCPLGKWERI